MQALFSDFNFKMHLAVSLQAILNGETQSYFFKS